MAARDSVAQTSVQTVAQFSAQINTLFRSRASRSARLFRISVPMTCSRPTLFSVVDSMGARSADWKRHRETHCLIGYKKQSQVNVHFISFIRLQRHR
jgi:hypothetical protein